MFFLFTLFGGAVNVGYKDTSISTILFFTFYLASNDFFFFLVPVYSLIFIQDFGEVQYKAGGGSDEFLYHICE
ncbi:unnamed protein product [Lathyrus oleraceus]